MLKDIDVKDRIKDIAKSLSNDYDKLIKAFTFFHLFLIACFFILNISNIFLILICTVPVPFLYIFCKDLWEEKVLNENSKQTLKVLKLSIYNFMFFLIYKLVVGMVTVGGEGGNVGYGTMRVLGLPVAFIVFIGLFLLSRSPKIVEYFEQVKTTPWMLKLGFNFMDLQKKPGDVQLCENKDSGLPVFIPKKDRYLHMLILGPTGSGKTSQTIIPMLNQDVQNMDAGITVLEPKGDLAEKIYAMCQYYGRPALYFNPILDSCPYFNPLQGKEEDVIENMTTTVKMLSPDSSTFFQNMGEDLIRNALKVLKRTKGDDATMIDLYRLIAGTREARSMVQALLSVKGDKEFMAENVDVVQYFMGEYFNDKMKTFEHCSGVRAQISKIVSNKFLRKVLNPPKGRGSDINWDAHLENGTVICITTAQGSLRDLGSFLGYLLILSYQSAVFKRPGNENTRKDHFLYIDEFQKYANPGFADMLTQGRSYRVASHLATQNRALIGMGSGQEGKDFIELVSTNARNLVLYPGGNSIDAKYYSEQFGEIIERKVQTGTSQAQFNPLYGFQKIGYANVSVRESEEEVARFSVNDIIYMEFGEIIYSIIKNNTVQIPAKGKIHYIDKNLNDLLDKMIPENHALMIMGYNPNECRDLSNHGALYEDIDIDTIMEAAEAKSNGKGLSMIEKSELEEAGENIREDNEFVELEEEDVPVQQSNNVKSEGIPSKVQISKTPTNIKSENSNSDDDFEDDF